MESKRFLLVTDSRPWPLRSGASQRTHHLVTALSKHGQVDVVIIGPEMPEDRIPPGLEDRMRLLFAPASVAEPSVSGKSLRRTPRFLAGVTGIKAVEEEAVRPVASLCQLIQDLDRRQRYALAVARYCRSALQAGFDRWSGRPPAIVDVDDVPWAVTASSGRAKKPGLKGTMIWRLRARAQKNAIRPRVKKLDHLWLAKRSDGQEFPGQSCSVLPNIPHRVNPASDDIETGARKNILIVGTIDYGPNLDGLRWFLREVWDRLRQQVPEIHLKIVGTIVNPAFSWQGEERPGVEFVGPVPDLAPYYREAAFTIAPIHWGGGTKIKIMESLAYRRTCVSTVHAAEGYEGSLTDGKEFLVAANAAGFADACARLWRDPALRDRLEAAGHAAIERSFSVGAFEAEVSRVVAQWAHRRDA